MTNSSFISTTTATATTAPTPATATATTAPTPAPAIPVPVTTAISDITAATNSNSRRIVLADGTIIDPDLGWDFD